MGWWKSKVAHQMLSCFCIFKNIIPSWMAPLALVLLFSSYKLAGFMFFSLILTSVAVFLSTVHFIWKLKAVPDDELAERNGFSLSSTSEEKRPNGRESVGIAPTPMHRNESEEERDSDDDSAAPSLDHKLLSESECQEVLFLSTSEDYEVDHTSECSDGTISDEDNLIEIALPSGHFVGHQQKEEFNSKYNNCSLQQKKALFNQQSLMEFLAEFNEMNEEENLIEIDISMGSIKCSRFEIEA